MRQELNVEAGNYKIENIANIRILDEDIKPLKSLPGQVNFSIKEYIKEHIYMTTGDSVRARIKVISEDKINSVIDWFGSDITIENYKGDTVVSLRVNEDALVYWAMQYGDIVEVLSPVSTRTKIKNMLDLMLAKYN